MPRRTSEPLGFVDHQKVDARAHCLVGELRALDQHLQRDHRASMKVEGIEACTKIALRVGEALRVEECEDLVILPPEFAQPLDRQRIRRDDEAALDLSGMHQSIQDERRFDGLAQTDLVGEQPSHWIRGARPFGDVKLVWEQPDASPKEGAQAVGLAKRQEVQDAHPRHEVLDVVEVTKGEALEECAFELERPERVWRRSASVRELQGSIREARDDPGFFSSRGDSYRPSGTQIDREQRIRAGRQSKRGSRARELDGERPALERCHASDTQLGIEAVCEVVADRPAKFSGWHSARTVLRQSVVACWDSPRGSCASAGLRRYTNGRLDGRAPMTSAAIGARVLKLGGDDVLGAGALRTLADREAHVLAFAQRVERSARARGLMEEVFRAVRCRNETEALVRNALDGAGC